MINIKSDSVNFWWSILKLLKNFKAVEEFKSCSSNISLNCIFAVTISWEDMKFQCWCSFSHPLKVLTMTCIFHVASPDWLLCAKKSMLTKSCQTMKNVALPTRFLFRVGFFFDIFSLMFVLDLDLDLNYWVHKILIIPQKYPLNAFIWMVYFRCL